MGYLLFLINTFIRAFSSGIISLATIFREYPHIQSTPQAFFPFSLVTSLITSASLNSSSLKPVCGIVFFSRYFSRPLVAFSWLSGEFSLNLSILSRKYLLTALAISSGRNHQYWHISTKLPRCISLSCVVASTARQRNCFAEGREYFSKNLTENDPYPVNENVALLRLPRYNAIVSLRAGGYFQNF